MTSAQGDRQAAVRVLTGTTYNYEGDWSALFNICSISQEGGWNGRLLAWINLQLNGSYTEINGAMAAYAAGCGAANWSSVGTLFPTYFIDPAGSDAANGKTPSSAWQTLAKVNSTTFPTPSIILFKGGSTFSGQLTLVAGQHFGTVGKSVLFGSYGTGRATISSGAAQYGVFATNPQYLTIRDLILVGTSQTTNSASGIGLVVDTEGPVKYSGVSVKNCDISLYGCSGIGALGVAATPSGFDGLIIDGNTVHDCGGNASAGSGVGIGVGGLGGLLTVAASHTNLLIQNNKVYNHTGAAGVGKNSGSGIVIGQCQNALIQFNEAYNNGALSNYSVSGPVGIWMYDSTSCTIQFNESHHNKTASGTPDGDGFDIDGGCVNCIVQYNYSHDNYGSGLQLYQYADATINAMSGNHIRYNISENDCQQNPTTKGAILIGNADTRNMPNNYVYGNTIYSTVASANGVYFSGAHPETFINGGLANNIFVINGTTSQLMGQASTAVPPASFLIQGNDWYTTQTFAMKWVSTVYSTLATWRAASSQETSGGFNTAQNSDPLLVGSLPVGTTNGFSASLLGAYKTQAASPCRNTGINVATVFGINPGTQDLFGDALSAPYDIGCFEDGAAVTLRVIGANRGGFPTTTNVSAITAPFTSKREHWSHAQGSIFGLKLTYCGWSCSTNSTTDAAYTAKAYIEYPAGTFTPVNDGAVFSVPAGGQIEVQSAFILIPANTRFWVRTVLMTSLGIGLQPAIQLASTTTGVSDGNLAGDNGNSGTINPTATSIFYGPSAIHANVMGSSRRGALIMGDSIPYSQGDTTGAGPLGSAGYVARLLDPVVPTVKMCIQGQRAADNVTLMNASGGNNSYNNFFKSLGLTEVFLEPGVNDLRTGVTQNALVTSYLSIISNIKASFPSAIVHQSTLTPRSTTSNGYADAAGQTPQNDGNWAALASTNAQIRGRISGVTGQIIDAADAAMTARDSGIWSGPFPPTSDGTHPNTGKVVDMVSKLTFA